MTLLIKLKYVPDYSIKRHITQSESVNFLDRTLLLISQEDYENDQLLKSLPKRLIIELNDFKLNLIN